MGQSRTGAGAARSAPRLAGTFCGAGRRICRHFILVADFL